MSPRAARRLLWLGLALLVPLPSLVLAPGWLPAGRFLMLFGVVVVVMLAETAAGLAPLIAGLLLAQAALYAALLWCVAWLASRALAQLSPRGVAVATLSTVAVGVALALAVDVYETPFAATAPRGNLLHVYR